MTDNTDNIEQEPSYRPNVSDNEEPIKKLENKLNDLDDKLSNDKTLLDLELGESHTTPREVLNIMKEHLESFVRAMDEFVEFIKKENIDTIFAIDKSGRYPAMILEEIYSKRNELSKLPMIKFINGHNLMEFDKKGFDSIESEKQGIKDYLRSKPDTKIALLEEYTSKEQYLDLAKELIKQLGHPDNQIFTATITHDQKASPKANYPGKSDSEFSHPIKDYISLRLADTAIYDKSADTSEPIYNSIKLLSRLKEDDFSKINFSLYSSKLEDCNLSDETKQTMRLRSEWLDTAIKYFVEKHY